MAVRTQTAAAHPSQSMRNFAFVAASPSAAVQLHGPLFTAVTALGHRVMCLTPDGADGGKLPDLGHGIKLKNYDPRPEGWSFLAQRRAALAVSETLQTWRTHCVVAAGEAGSLLLPMIAAQQAGILERIAVLTQSFNADDASLVQAWRKTLAASTSAVFFTRDDVRAALKAGALAKTMPVTVVPGAGVDLMTSCVLPLPNLGEGLVFLADANDYVSGAVQHAAAAVTAAYPKVRMVMIKGPIDIKAFRTALEHCHVYVQGPHSESLPTGMLEVLAAGRAIIAADTPGGRDAVDEFVNGCRVPPNSAAALADAMKVFINQPDLIATAARASRMKAERWFDRRDVNQAWLKTLALAT